MKTVSVATTGLISIALVACGSASAATAPPRPAFVRAQDVSPLDVLEERIGAYAALRHRLEAPLPPLEPTTDMKAIYARKARLASAIRAARSGARQGDVLTPTVAAHLRGAVREALQGVDVSALLLDLYDEHEIPRDFQARVHDTYPWWATHTMPPTLLRRLPPLPADIEYRLIGYDLILLDLRASLIIDILPGAIPPPNPRFQR